MIRLDRAMATSYKLATITVSICSCLAAIVNGRLLAAAVAHVRRITESYFSVDFIVLYSNVTTACMGRQSLRKIVLSATQSRTLAFRYRR